MRLALALAVILAFVTFAVQADPRFARDRPKAGFSSAVIDLSEVVSAGPRKDGIPAIDRPRCRPVARETRASPSPIPFFNTGLVFDRHGGGQVLDFGRSGLLRHSDVIIHDHQTESWRQQAPALERGDPGAGREVGNVRVTDAQGRDVVHDMRFACAFHAFHPDGRWMLD